MTILQNINHILMKNLYPLNCQMILITVMMYIVNLYNIVKILIIYVVLLLIIVYNPVYWLFPLLGLGTVIHMDGQNR